jgi:hypothetical protein
MVMAETVYIVVQSNHMINLELKAHKVQKFYSYQFMASSMKEKLKKLNAGICETLICCI